MSDKKDNLDRKPWEKSFEDDRDVDGNYSRSANRRKTKNGSLLTTGLLVVFVAIVIGTIGFYIVESNKVYQPESTTTSESSSSKTTSAKSDGKADSESKAKAKSESKEKAKAKASSESEAKESSEKKAKEDSESKASTNDYVTVEAGQGLYRIATNNNLTVQELLNLNPGLTADSAISAGQKLKIK